ncbi:MAG TPA: pyridoxal phosphate-dependent aminotransferase, partial [Anaerolineae bacterium]|nr:pyridoxal phosphate-dependent aminotransferase [Anaerolineae bacterium]
MKLAARMSRLGTETAFEVLARARALEAQGHTIIHLEIGEPDFDTPQHIIDEATHALNNHGTHYTPSAGIPELRKTIAEYVSRTRNIEVTPDMVVVVPGGKPIIFFGLMALIERVDEVIYPSPGFPIYESMIHFVSAHGVPIPLRMENDFAFDLDDLEKAITPQTRMIVINSPANPTGGVLRRSALEKIAQFAIKHDLIVFSDEIYSRIIYDEEFLSIASLPGMQERTIILDGFSKTYAMTGWRLGYGVMPVNVAQAVSRLITNSTSCTATATQFAGVKALTSSQGNVDQMVTAFRQRREVIVNGLNQIPGFKCLMPAGAF